MSSSIPLVVLPLDGSHHSLDALPVARALAAIKGATLEVIYIGERHLPPKALLSKLGLAEEDMRGTVLEQRGGEAGEQIAMAASQASDALIVMCTHAGSPSIAGGTLGRVAARVLLDADCPLVLVRPARGARPWRLGRILVAHDGTPTTTASIHPAAELARAAGSQLTVLHVASGARAASKSAPTERGTLTAPRYVDQRQHEWPAWAHEFTQRLLATCPIDPATFRLMLSSGDPAAAVVRQAREQEVDLIVLAWLGSLGEHRAAVVKEALRHAPCPVMVLRALHAPG